ncbi:MAG: hypothetical protein K6B44_07660 [Lachnospiraceae bacterium]|nr:hypothetical protein [Lachnospiraceae bacterium]
MRTRVNQPTGWNESVHGKSLSFNMKMHDYVYYPHSWINEQGVQYREGYYDENGQYYANMVARGMQTTLQCTYCGNHMAYTWKEGMVPTCDKCGGVFQIDITDVPKKAENKTIWMILLAVFILPLLWLPLAFIVLLFFFIKDGITGNDTELFRDSSQSAVVSDYEPSGSTLPKSIYVKETGHTCYPDGENMYDMESDCWFWWNTDVLPAQWQYWYEGISSDYGDYGWMEFYDSEQKWYIEVAEDDWQELTGYDTSELWHFENAYINEYY